MKKLDIISITKLRCDANFYEIYEGEQKKRGRKRVKGEKILWKKLKKEDWQWEGKTEKGHFVWTKILWAAQWKRKLKVAYVEMGQGKYSLLASRTFFTRKENFFSTNA